MGREDGELLAAGLIYKRTFCNQCPQKWVADDRQIGLSNMGSELWYNSRNWCESRLMSHSCQLSVISASYAFCELWRPWFLHLFNPIILEFIKVRKRTLDGIWHILDTGKHVFKEVQRYSVNLMQNPGNNVGWFPKQTWLEPARWIGVGITQLTSVIY